MYTRPGFDRTARRRSTLTGRLARLILPSILALAFPAGTAAAGGPLYPNPVYACRGGPFSIASGDFNDDGRPDLAVTNQWADRIAVFLGRGEGEFGAATGFAAGDQPIALAVDDLNADGDPDIAVLNHASGDISTLDGRGDGTFAPQVRLPIGIAPPGDDPATYSPLALAIGHFNGDGRPDLAAANVIDVSILLGGVDGFGNPVRFGAGSEPSSVTIADFDADGRQDLAVANYLSHDISILRGRGDGTFAAETRIAAGLHPLAIVSGDFDGDGAIDLATANTQGVNPQNSRVGDVTVLHGRGDGTFMAFSRFEVGEFPLGLLVADPDRDGVADLVAADVGSNDLSWLRGRGDGSFESHRRISAGLNPAALVSGDFDGDGVPDFAVATPGSDQITILHGLGEGAFAPVIRVRTDGRPLSLARGDLDGDGDQDLAVTLSGSQSDRVAHLEGRGDGRFDPAGEYPVGFDPAGVTIGDVDEDGRQDLIVANFGPFGLSILAALDDGSFGSERRIETGYGPRSVAVADFNADGHPDLASVNNGTGDLSIILGLGDGDFEAERRFDVGRAPVGISIGEFDGDGIPDLAVTNTGSDDISTTIAGDISVLPGRGDGTFATERRYPAGLVPWAIGHGDFDRDGLADLAVTNSNDASVSVLRGRGDGSFDEELRFDTAIFPFPLAVADLDGDRLLDLAMVSLEQDVISILTGRGDGTFEPERRYLAGRSPQSLVVGDFDGDGAPDLAVANLFPRDIWILPNQRPDLDGDGHRPPADCDESDGAIHPGALDLPGNVVDEDCDGALGDCNPCFPWASHGHYVRCVARALGDLFAGGLLSAERRVVLLRSAAGSDIGKSDIGNTNGGFRCAR